MSLFIVGVLLLSLALAYQRYRRGSPQDQQRWQVELRAESAFSDEAVQRRVDRLNKQGQFPIG